METAAAAGALAVRTVDAGVVSLGVVVMSPPACAGVLLVATLSMCTALVSVCMTTGDALEEDVLERGVSPLAATRMTRPETGRGERAA